MAGAGVYSVVTRATDEPAWRKDLTLVYIDGSKADNDAAVAEARTFTHVKNLRGDDWMFGVAACAGMFCSPVSSAVPGGAFEPVAKE